MPATIIGMSGDLERLTWNYWLLVQRIRRLPIGASAGSVILADIEVLFRREREDHRARPATIRRQVDDMGDDMAGK